MRDRSVYMPFLHRGQTVLLEQQPAQLFLQQQAAVVLTPTTLLLQLLFQACAEPL